jgi:hypothetical protein
MAATYPSGDPDRYDAEDDRRTLSEAPMPRTGRSPRVAVAIAVVVIAVIAVVAYTFFYMFFFNGESAAGAGGGNGGGYFIVAFSGEAIRRVVGKMRR